MWGAHAALTAPQLLRASNRPFFVSLQGCASGSGPAANRPGGAACPPPPSLRPQRRGRGRGAGSRRRAGGVPRRQCWRLHRVCSAARASQRLLLAVRPHRARPAMTAATLQPRAGWLTLLLPLLLLRVGPVRADSKVLSALGPGSRSAGSLARGGAMAGGARQGCAGSGAKDQESVKRSSSFTRKLLESGPGERSA